MGYHPSKAKIDPQEWRTWLNSPVHMDLNSAPGLTPEAIKKLGTCKLEEDRITNTCQLFGKFLMLKGPGHEQSFSEKPNNEVDTFEHMERFWCYLMIRGINENRSTIVRAIAEKSAIFFLDIYDPDDYIDDYTTESSSVSECMFDADRIRGI